MPVSVWCEDYGDSGVRHWFNDMRKTWKYQIRHNSWTHRRWTHRVLRVFSIIIITRCAHVCDRIVIRFGATVTLFVIIFTMFLLLLLLLQKIFQRDGGTMESRTINQVYRCVSYQELIFFLHSFSSPNCRSSSRSPLGLVWVSFFTCNFCIIRMKLTLTYPLGTWICDLNRFVNSN